jgi:beta-phosphoglucomutase
MEACLPDGEIQAVLFDFNGTLCDDAPVIVRIYRQIAEEAGLSLPESMIPSAMGMSDAEVFSELLRRSGLHSEDALVERLTQRRRDLYLQCVAGAPPIPAGRRRLVRKLASHVPLGIVSGAFRQEITAVLCAASLHDAVTTAVTIDDVTRGKPDPEGWLLGLANLNSRAGRSVPPSRVLAVDDSAEGLRGARRAGMRTAAVSNGVSPPPRAEADFILGSLDEGSETEFLSLLKAGPPADGHGRGEERHVR